MHARLRIALVARGRAALGVALRRWSGMLVRVVADDFVRRAVENAIEASAASAANPAAAVGGEGRGDDGHSAQVPLRETREDWEVVAASIKHSAGGIWGDGEFCGASNMGGSSSAGVALLGRQQRGPQQLAPGRRRLLDTAILLLAREVHLLSCHAHPVVAGCAGCVLPRNSSVLFPSLSHSLPLTRRRDLCRYAGCDTRCAWRSSTWRRRRSR